MPSRGSRWSLLVIFAACNLVFWIAVAAGIGVVASDMVDLGLESYLREKQATVAALGGQAPTRLPSRTPGPTSGVGAAPAPTGAVGGQVLEEEAVVAGVEPTESSAAPSATPQPRRTAARMTPYATRTLPPPTLVVRATPSTSSNSPPASQVAAALASDPLLLADPSLSELMALDAEIRQSAAGRPVQIRYREAALNKELTAALAEEQDLPYRNIQADLKSDAVTLTGDVIVAEVAFPTVITGKVLAQDCLPHVEIESVSVSGIFTPAFIRDRIEAIVDDAFAWYPEDYALCLEQIVMETDRATIYGSTR